MNFDRKPGRARPPRIVRLDLMWMIGAPLIAFFGVGGVLFWIFLPGIGIGPIWVAVAVLLLVIYGVITWSVRGRRQRAERLLREGLPGFARILEAEGTGVSVNHRPQVRLRLRVEVSGRASYETEIREVLPFLGLESVGADRRVPVVVDRENPQQLIIDWSGIADAASSATPARPSRESAATPDGDDTASRLEKLEFLRRRKLISESEFDTLRRKLLSEI
ncbi:MAG: hypothetical protein ACREUE_14505 [Panacagrimonas sp.]